MRGDAFPTKLMVENCEALVTPLPGGAYIQKLTEAVASAKLQVDVIQYQWNFYPHDPTNAMQEFNRQVLGAAARGVKFRVQLNVEKGNARITDINHRAKNNLTEAGIQVKFSPILPIMHAKLFIVDDDYVLVGSHNLSLRAVTVNDETSVLIKSRPVAMEFRRYFELLWNRK